MMMNEGKKSGGDKEWATEWERKVDWSVKIDVANIGDANQLIRNIYINWRALRLSFSVSSIHFIPFHTSCKQTVDFFQRNGALAMSYDMKHLWISFK